MTSAYTDSTDIKEHNDSHILYLFSTGYPDKFKGSYNYMDNMVYRITSNPKKDRNPSCAYRLDCLCVLKPF